MPGRDMTLQSSHSQRITLLAAGENHIRRVDKTSGWYTVKNGEHTGRTVHVMLAVFNSKMPHRCIYPFRLSAQHQQCFQRFGLSLRVLHQHTQLHPLINTAPTRV